MCIVPRELGLVKATKEQREQRNKGTKKNYIGIVLSPNQESCACMKELNWEYGAVELSVIICFFSAQQ